MDSSPIDNLITRQMPALRAVAIGFSVSVLVHIGVAWLVVTMVLSGPLMELPLAVTTGIAISQLLIILAGYLLSRSMRRDPRGIAGTSTRRSPVDTGVLLQRYTRSVVVACAMREVASVVGLLLSLATGDVIWVVSLGGAALVSMLVHWPRRAAVEDWLRQQGISTA